MLDRLSLALLVGGSLFVFFTGILNIQLFYPWNFSLRPGALLRRLHLPRGARPPSGEQAPGRAPGVSRARACSPRFATTSPTPSPSRRATGLDRAGCARGAATIIAPRAARRPSAPARSACSLIAHRPGRRRTVCASSPSSRRAAPDRPGPNGFQVNKSFAAVGDRREARPAARWRLRDRRAERRLELTRGELLAMEQRTETLPIACVEGWSTTQEVDRGPARASSPRWPGVDGEARASRSSRCRRGGSFREATLSRGRWPTARSLLALRVNGADLSLDHGYPGADHRPGGPRCPLHEVGRDDARSRTVS